MRVGVKTIQEATKRSARLRHKAYEPSLDGLAQWELDRRHDDLFFKAPEIIKMRRDELNIIDDDKFLDAIDDPNPYLTRWAMMYLR